MYENDEMLGKEEIDVPKKMNVLKRIGNLIVSPKKLFAYIKQKPSILFPVIILSVISLLAVLLLWEPTRDLLMDTSYTTSKNMGMNYSAEYLESLVNAQMIVTLVASPLIILATWSVTTLILYAIYRLVGCEKGLKKYFSMVGYIMIIMVLGSLLHTVYLYFTGGDMGSAAVTSLASLLNQDSLGTFLYSITSGIEVFSIWTYILYAIGFTYIGGVEKRKSYITAAVIFIVFTLLSAGFTSLGGSLAAGIIG